MTATAQAPRTREAVDTAPPTNTSLAKVHDAEVLAPGAIIPQRITFALHPELERMGDFAGRLVFAAQIHESGLAPYTLDSPAKVFVALQMGAELGLPPWYAIQNTVVVKGKAGLQYEAMLAVARSTGLLEEYTEEWDHAITPTVCRVWIKRRGRAGFTSEFHMAEADQAGLTRPSPKGEPSMYTKYPKRMLRARAGSFGIKREFGDVLAGLYTPEELAESRDEREPEPAAPANKALAAPPAPKAAHPAEWRLETDVYLAAKRLIGNKKMPAPEVNAIILSATGGVEVPRGADGVPKYNEAQWIAIERAVRAWTAPTPAAAPPPAPVATAAPVNLDADEAPDNEAGKSAWDFMERL